MSTREEFLGLQIQDSRTLMKPHLEKFIIFFRGAIVKRLKPYHNSPLLIIPYLLINYKDDDDIRKLRQIVINRSPLSTEDLRLLIMKKLFGYEMNARTNGPHPRNFNCTEIQKFTEHCGSQEFRNQISAIVEDPNLGYNFNKDDRKDTRLLLRRMYHNILPRRKRNRILIFDDEDELDVDPAEEELTPEDNQYIDMNRILAM